MKEIGLVLFYIICNLNEAENKSVRIKITYDISQNIYKCFANTFVVDENYLTSINVEVDAPVRQVTCGNKYRSLTMYYHNDSTKIEYKSEIFVATLSMSSLWKCILYNTDIVAQCDIPMHVRGFNIPQIKINENELTGRRPSYSVIDYDAEIQYKFDEGELLRIDCIDNLAQGMKFVYSGFEIAESNTYLPTEFIYGTTLIHSRVGMKSARKNAYIDCVVKRDEHYKVVVRVRLVLRQEVMDKAIAVYGLRPSNILLQSQSEIDVDVIFYEYEERESLNLTWFLNPEGLYKGHVRITWKDTVLEDIVLDTPLSGYLASHVFSLSAEDNRTVINCSIRKQLYWSKELKIVLLLTLQPSTDQIPSEPLSLGTFLILGVGCVLSMALIKVAILIIRKAKSKTIGHMNETEVSNCDSTDDRVNSQFPKSLDDYVQSMATNNHETTATTVPTSLYSDPIPKCEGGAMKTNNSVHGNLENPVNLY